ncbi:MAG: 4-(cytidine 5'-diphospho)-2-C-methyl-D-erythritol kinase [Actinomycetota bacterium]
MSAPTIRRDAHAKINVFLRVLAAREDGYHDLESLVVPISLADRVTVGPDERLHVETKGAAALVGEVPAGGLNLALVAALALADACPDAGGARVEIDKHIPVAAGLGGGSADAAATLLALNELWGCGLDLATLVDVGERIGSDVPAMLAGGPVLMSGRGELLAPAPCASFWWVVVTLGFGVRSPDAYRWWDEDGAARGPDPGPVLDAAAAGDPEVLGPLLFNDLESPVIARHPEIGAARGRLLEAGALGAVMSGSGSSVVGLARDREHAASLAAGFADAFVATGPPAPAAASEAPAAPSAAPPTAERR